jgi:hypothetical protein
MYICRILALIPQAWESTQIFRLFRDEKNVSNEMPCQLERTLFQTTDHWVDARPGHKFGIPETNPH